MKHIDLFSGIGGFSYAADQVWPNVEHIFCDIDPFAHAITQKHWPGSKHYEDIRQLIADAEYQRWGRVGDAQRQGNEDKIGRANQRCWLVTGGFPCQPFSQAGRRRGTNDDRWLWPQMFQVIRLTAPTWVIGENVGGFVTWNKGMVLEQVCTDLEGAGYEVQPFIIPACAVNAPHRRDRVWIVGHSKGQHQRFDGIRPEGSQEQIGGSGRGDVGNTKHEGLEGQFDTDKTTKGRKSQNGSDSETGWGRSWVEVASELCRMDDGLPARVDGLELTKFAHRRERLKSLGNAIVPQVAVQIMKAIRMADYEIQTKNAAPADKKREEQSSVAGKLPAQTD